MSRSRLQLQLEATEKEARELCRQGIAAGTAAGIPMIRQAMSEKYHPLAMKTSEAELICNVANAALTYFLLQHRELISDYRDDEKCDPFPVCVSFVQVKVAIGADLRCLEAGMSALNEWRSANVTEPESFFLGQQEEWAQLLATSNVILSEFRERLAWFKSESRRRGQATFLEDWN